MLPSLAKLDRDFSEACYELVQACARSRGLIGQIKSHHVIHEGKTNAIRRSEADFEQIQMFKATAEATMHFDEIDEVDFKYIGKKIIELADQFETQLSKTLLQTFDDVTRATGQVVDARGQPLTNEVVLEMLSKMAIDFEGSKHGDLTLVTPPQMVPTFRKLDMEFKTNREIRKKFDDLMEKKRDEFREREINRNLVG
jgi:hypothetical protein